MGVTAAFNYANWLALFPEFAQTVNVDLANELFAVAVTIHRNDGAGPVKSGQLQTFALKYLVAHLAMLFAGTATQPASQMVGRVSNATEGSVSVQTEYNVPVSASRAWYDQTKYGATYWQMTAPYRTFRYRRGPTRRFNPFPGGFLLR